MSDWHSEALGSEATQILDGDRGKNYPSKQQLLPSGDCLFLSAANVTKRGFDFSSCEFISAEKDNSLRKGKLQRHDCVLTTRGTVGNVAYFGQEVSFENIRINSGMVIIRPDQNLLSPKFLSFFLRSEAFSDQIVSLTSGSAQPQLPIRDLKQVQIPIPPLHEQREIAAILGALDDKIELNRKTAATLEEMARALYRSWFVDFDPVWAKLEGRAPAHMDATTAALFPFRFDADGLPEGWKQATLNDVARNIRKQVQPADVASETPYIGLEHMPRRSLSVSDWATAGKVGSAKSSMSRGQCVFGKLRPYFHKVALVPTDGICSTDILVIEAKKDFWRPFVVSVISSVDFVDHADASSSGTRMPRANWRDMSRFEIVIPKDDVSSAFFRIVDPMHQCILSIVEENQTLATLRDTLLPRLMSGDLRVGEAREQVEEVA
ncbi:restriction endonuclease subunit S [Roseibium sp.]|uniref:restriction endonuclease subunit S n=1 Tax=Roseibium sp. TaxID=1936156 RepID=UPI003A971D2E